MRRLTLVPNVPPAAERVFQVTFFAEIKAPTQAMADVRASRLATRIQLDAASVSYDIEEAKP